MNPNSINFISSDVEITGTVTCGSKMISEGKIIGDIVSLDLFVVGKGGMVQGNIEAQSVSIHGKVKGNVTVTERCELKSNAELLGDLTAPRLLFEDGATLIGYSKVTPGRDYAPAPAERRELPAAPVKAPVTGR